MKVNDSPYDMYFQVVESISIFKILVRKTEKQIATNF